MGDLYTELIKEKKRLSEKVAFINSFLERAPEGILAIALRKNRTICYRKSTNSEKHAEKEYIKKEDIQLAKDLALKQYYKKLLPELTSRLALIDSVITTFKSNPEDELIKNLSPERKTLINPLLMTTEEKVQNFSRKSGQNKGISEGHTRYLTFMGEEVRSKSEKIIADELARAGVPYKYESPQKLKGYDKDIYPDFTIMNSRNGKVYFWEHFGKMDNPEYFESVQWRMDLYGKNGIIPGAGLILTFESSRSPLNINIIRWNIREYLL